jgi:hypothetical protein
LLAQVANKDANTLTGEITSSANAMYKHACTCCSYAVSWILAGVLLFEASAASFCLVFMSFT